MTTPPRRTANLSAEQMRTAVTQLERRLAELKALEPEKIPPDSGDDILRELENKIDTTLVRVFGHDTVEYDRYRVSELRGRVRAKYGSDPSFRGRLPGIRQDLATAVANLRSARDSLQEQIEDDAGTSEGRALRAYEGLELHPEIARAASKRFRDGHYADAVEAAVKALNGLVRLRSGLELDGAKLMQKAFSPNAPILAFNALASLFDQDEQRGYMMLFDGAVAGLRNPRAHGFVQDRPERALEFIAFVSLLAKLLDDATNT